MSNEKKPAELTGEENFRKEIKRIRQEKGWKQSDLAKRMADAGWGEYNQTTISRLESLTKGKSRPLTLAEANTLARVLETSVDAMMRASNLQNAGRGLIEKVFRLEKAQRDLEEEAQKFTDLSSSLILDLMIVEQLGEKKIRDDMGEMGDFFEEMLEKAKAYTSQTAADVISDYIEKISPKESGQNNEQA